MDNVAEIWRPVVGQEGLYEVSSIGNVRSLDRVVSRRTSCMKRRGKKLRHNRTPTGYLFVATDGGRRQYIHRMVASAFIGECPKDCTDVNHKNGDKSDNRVENLEWCSRYHNMRHAYDNGMIVNTGPLHPRAKYTEGQIREAVELVRNGSRRSDAARITGVAAATVENVCRGTQWKYLGLSLKT